MARAFFVGGQVVLVVARARSSAAGAGLPDIRALALGRDRAGGALLSEGSGRADGRSMMLVPAEEQDCRIGVPACTLDCHRLRSVP